MPTPKEKTTKMKAKRRKPKEGERYWLVRLGYDGLEVVWTIWEESEISYEDLRLGNCFPTRKAATKMVKKIKALLKNG